MSEQPPPMGDDFQARMRRGLSTMAVRERVRERRRTQAIAGGALAVIAAAVVGVGAWQLADATGDPQRDQAAPTPSVSQPADTPAPSEPGASEPAPTDRPDPTAPPGLEGVAAGEPEVLDVLRCEECGDAGAAGQAPVVERTFDVYLVCEADGTVDYGGQRWIDCADHPAGTGFTQLGVPDLIDDGDPRFTASDDFDGALSIVDAGAPPVGSIDGASATVSVVCHRDQGAVTVGGVRFDCTAGWEGPGVQSVIQAAWGVPIRPGEIGPRIELDGDALASVTYAVER
jgi:hypothetical protein